MGVHVVWFKRDMRVADHAPLREAAAAGRVLPLYIFEPSLVHQPESDPSHWDFVRGSLAELSERLRRAGTPLAVRIGELPGCFEQLADELRPFGGIERLWSHEETGNRLTYDRDRRVAAWVNRRGIPWTQRPQHGVVRGLNDRDGWAARWARRMRGDPLPPPAQLNGLPPRGFDFGRIPTPDDLGLPACSKPDAQRPGEAEAHRALDSFLDVRGQNYRQDMASPVTAMGGCSRLSPHIAYGTISVRAVHAAARERVDELKRADPGKRPPLWLASLRSFQSRLRWHCHFMQKLEDEPGIEHRNMNRAYDGLRMEDPADWTEEERLKFEAWCAGRTGYPLVDACMRCLHAGGWINFRMRAMLVSFASYHLWLHWRPTAVYLARQFIDFEPGIHFSQFQMQSGTTGINSVRIYSPIKQAKDNDPSGLFIRRWVPELTAVPTECIAEPHKHFGTEPGTLFAPGDSAAQKLGAPYPPPIVDHKRAYAEAKRRIFERRSKASTRREAQRVYFKHGSRKRPGQSAGRHDDDRGGAVERTAWMRGEDAIARAATRPIDTLPEHLRERCLPLNDRPPKQDGDFVVCWLQHAIRDHDNPALDTAVELGNRLDRPVLVYQGLGGNHRFNSDRHHAFILEGARDLQRGLRQRGIACAFYLPRDPARPSPLRSLIERSCALVTEDFPAPPMPQWTRAHAQRSPGCALAVDATCLMPMRLAGKRHDRAFQFRKAAEEEHRERIDVVWRDAQPGVHPPSLESLDLPFEPIDLENADIAALVGACAIDHTLAPVADTEGGSRAGYARWERYRRENLKSYGKRRNDAADLGGVSRLSPYLHHGHVSVFRIAREAKQTGGDGARKFLDELLVWRELAHNFCAYSDPGELESVSILPAWAIETLREHEADPRPAIYSWEALARGRTDDELWNAAQRSLLAAGELHNNLRMTWGKALVNWTRCVEDALELLFDFNHRFSLDGNDPNSYGGLLWCLGALDRPFKPPKPIHGTVRGRSTEQHAARLDLDAYKELVESRGAASGVQVVVIGGGMAGMTAARTLADQGASITIFDKGRGPGGRMSTRRIEAPTGDMSIDHGAQYFTARDQRFAQLVRSWQDDGIVAEWTGRFGRITPDGAFGEKTPTAARYVGTPGMNAVVRHLADTLGERCEVRYDAKVDRLRWEEGAWRVMLADGTQRGPFDAAVVAVPAKQAARLLEDTPHLRDEVSKIELRPCLTAMLRLKKPSKIEFDAAFVDEHQQAPIDRVGWLARNSSKPGRAREPEVWIVNGTPEFSQAHLEEDPRRAAELLSEAWSRVTGVSTDAIEHLDGHRWRYALADHPLEHECLIETNRRVAVCGDWCRGPRVQAAYLSGAAAAGQMLNHLALTRR